MRTSPPALLYNDYDDTDAGTDYCALFTAHTACGTLLPGQRATTTPQFGMETLDIQLTAGDTANSVTANILLPATLVVGDATQDLMWRVLHDPEAVASKVSVSSGTLEVDDDSRTSTRLVILRATTGAEGAETLVNDYRLRIIEGSGGLQNPGLRFTTPVDTLLSGGTHSFAVSSLSSGAISYSVTDADGNATALATINSTTGMLTAAAVGTVKVTATVAADGGYSGATTSHTLTILDSPNLAFASTVVNLELNATHDFSAHQRLQRGDQLPRHQYRRYRHRPCLH